MKKIEGAFYGLYGVNPFFLFLLFSTAKAGWMFVVETYSRSHPFRLACSAWRESTSSLRLPTCRPESLFVSLFLFFFRISLAVVSTGGIVAKLQHSTS